MLTKLQQLHFANNQMSSSVNKRPAAANTVCCATSGTSASGHIDRTGIIGIEKEPFAQSHCLIGRHQQAAAAGCFSPSSGSMMYFTSCVNSRRPGNTDRLLAADRDAEALVLSCSVLRRCHLKGRLHVLWPFRPCAFSGVRVPRCSFPPGPASICLQSPACNHHTRLMAVYLHGVHTRCAFCCALPVSARCTLCTLPSADACRPRWIHMDTGVGYPETAIQYHACFFTKSAVDMSVMS